MRGTPTGRPRPRRRRARSGTAPAMAMTDALRGAEATATSPATAIPPQSPPPPSRHFPCPFNTLLTWRHAPSHSHLWPYYNALRPIEQRLPQFSCPPFQMAEGQRYSITKSRYQLERNNKMEEEGEDETMKSPLNFLANGGSDGADRFRGVRRERPVRVRVVRQKSPSRITVYGRYFFASSTTCSVPSLGLGGGLIATPGNKKSRPEAVSNGPKKAKLRCFSHLIPNEGRPRRAGRGRGGRERAHSLLVLLQPSLRPQSSLPLNGPDTSNGAMGK